MQRLRAADAKTSGGRHYDLHDSARSGMRNRACVMPGFDTGNSMQKQRINIVSTSSAVNQRRKSDSRPCAARRSAYRHRSCLPVSPIHTLLAELGWRSQCAAWPIEQSALICRQLFCLWHGRSNKPHIAPSLTRGFLPLCRRKQLIPSRPA